MKKIIVVFALAIQTIYIAAMDPLQTNQPSDTQQQVDECMEAVYSDPRDGIVHNLADMPTFETKQLPPLFADLELSGQQSTDVLIATPPQAEALETQLLIPPQSMRSPSPQSNASSEASELQESDESYSANDQEADEYAFEPDAPSDQPDREIPEPDKPSSEIQHPDEPCDLQEPEFMCAKATELLKIQEKDKTESPSASDQAIESTSKKRKNAIALDALAQAFGKNKTKKRECKVQCPECGIMMRDAYAIKVHRITHTGERTKECKVCHEYFRIKAELDRHMLTHSGEKPFKCTKGL